MTAFDRDQTAFSHLFERYRRPYTLFAYSYIKDMDDAKDIYMDVMLRFWEKRDQLPEDINLPSYLLGAVKMASLNYLRNLQVRTDIHNKLSEHKLRELNFRISTMEVCEPSELFTEDIKRIIEETLTSLPEQTYMIFFLSRYENRTNKEIAEELGISVKTVEYHMGKTLKILRHNLKDYLPLMLLLGLMK